MWGRILQIAVAGWIAASPLLLGVGDGGGIATAINLGGAAIMAILAAASMHPRWPHLHLGSALPALGLIGAAFLLSGHPAPPLQQSNIIASLLLLILVLVPTHANRPPAGWEEFNQRYRQETGGTDTPGA